MAWSINLQDLRNIDFEKIDIENMGSWPVVVKALVLMVIFVAVCVVAYFVDARTELDHLAQEQQHEQQLKEDFKTKAFQAANLEAYRAQLQQMEKTLGTLLRQLPSDTEVPGLLEDISRTGLGSGLEFESIKLLEEKNVEFYAELPIEIRVKGGFHEFGAFVSGVSSLSRIVTLHDFAIEPLSDQLLSMTITAKTYRYNSEKGAAEEEKK